MAKWVGLFGIVIRGAGFLLPCVNIGPSFLSKPEMDGICPG